VVRALKTTTSHIARSTRASSAIAIFLVPLTYRASDRPPCGRHPSQG
jgi:hypothetical protein